MACSKVVRTFHAKLHSTSTVTWSVESDSYHWNMYAENNYTCIGCKTQKPYVLDFLHCNSAFCLDCLEYVFANSIQSFNEYHQTNFETEHAVLKTKKVDLKKRIRAEKTKSCAYYNLKSELNDVKAKQMNLKKFATTPVQKLVPAPTAPPAAIKKAIDVTRFQWFFFGETSKLCTNLNGLCKKCNETKTLTVFIHEKENRVAFCLNCIRILFGEMKPTKEDYEIELVKLKQKELTEQEQFQKSSKIRQDKIDQMQALMKQLE